MATKRKPLKGYTYRYISGIKHSDRSVHVPSLRHPAVVPYGIQGGRIRELGVAIHRTNASYEPQFVIYGHSQVSDSPTYPYGPAYGLVLDRERVEVLVTLLLQALGDDVAT